MNPPPVRGTLVAGRGVIGRSAIRPNVALVNLQMTADEAALLARILANYLSDLRMEVADTDNATMRRALKSEEDTVRALLSRVEQAVN
jgi:hypothetical protein